MAKTIARVETGITPQKPSGGVEIQSVGGSDHVPTLYVNHTNIETSIWDVRLRLGETLETDRDRNILRVRELANVRMSPQHARVVLRLLAKHLENYELQFGKIPSAPGASAAEESDNREQQRKKK